MSDERKVLKTVNITSIQLRSVDGSWMEVEVCPERKQVAFLDKYGIMTISADQFREMSKMVLDIMDQADEADN